jgi:hypothetical protein
MNDKNTIVYGSIIGCTEHLVTLAPRSIIDHKQFFHTPTSMFNYKWYKGIYPTMLGVSFAHVSLFSCLQQSKKYSDNNWKVTGYGILGKFAHDCFMVPGDTIRQRSNLLQSTSIDAFRHIVKTNGYKGLFVGLGPSLLMNIPSGSIEFLTLKYMNQYYGNDNIQPYINGAMAGIFSSIIVSPIDTIKTCLQSRGVNDQFKTTDKVSDIVQKVWKTRGGLSGFFRGMMMRTLSASLSYGTFEFLCNRFNLEIEDH